MARSKRRLLVVVAAFALAAPTVRAADKCVAKVVIGGQPATLKSCAVALYDTGVTLWLTERPLSADELSTFQLNSYATNRDSSGRPLTMMHFAFCPGGGKPTPSAAAVKSVEVSVNHASSPMYQQQWVFELPRDKAKLRIEKLSGDLKPGGKLAGRITGAEAIGEQKYSWNVDFDVALPAKGAAAGPGCGGS